MQFLSPAALRAIEDRALEALLRRDDCLVAAGEGEIRGLASVALLSADYAVLVRGATLRLDSPAALAAAESRGACAPAAVISPDDALANALCDEVIDEDAHAWFTRWLGTRSADALDAAAILIRGNGGDAKERAVFANLFARGIPQAGLRAFLTRKS